uniref:Uncharacterized protein n=1 Tax=Rhizophora mucronata TaxID=61149 RepID=A0A2P2NSP9_RHIMU
MLPLLIALSLFNPIFGMIFVLTNFPWGFLLLRGLLGIIKP